MFIDDLQGLVHSLNPRETAYFSEFLKKSKSKHYNLYCGMFRHIRKHTVYDEDLLIKKFKLLTTGLRFSDIKNTLVEYIVSSLVSFHSRSAIVFKIHRLIEIAVLLYEKR